MFSPLYNRLCGWLFFILGVLGLWTGQVGDYARMSPVDSFLSVALGLLGMAGARSRTRYAVTSALGLGFLLFMWGVWGLTVKNSWLGSSEPAETALHLVCGAWGMYLSVQDVLQWRKS